MYDWQQRGYKNRSSIAHAYLADKIAERDPGNKPDVNDRIPYVYYETYKKVSQSGNEHQYSIDLAKDEYVKSLFKNSINTLWITFKN